MPQRFYLPLWFAMILMLAAMTGALAQADPKALRQQHFETIARGDVVAALALYTDDAVIDGTGLCAREPCVGKAAIQKELERRVAEKIAATGLSYYVSGPVVTTRFEVSSDLIKNAGVERMIGWDIFEMKGDKIGAARGNVWERTDPQTARYLEWQRAQQATR
jgi:ketosteroid isomerase-like protein